MPESQQNGTQERSPLLNDVPVGQKFVLSNGMPISNLESLSNVLKNSDDSIFYNHVNDSKNDFANWIKGCIKHDQLSEKLMIIKQKTDFLKTLDDEIELLKNPKLSETAKFFEENMGEEKLAENPQKQETPVSESSNVEKVSNAPSASAASPVSSSASAASPVSSSASAASPVSSSASAPPATPLAIPPANKNAVITLDFEQFLAPLIQEFENEIAQSDQ